MIEWKFHKGEFNIVSNAVIDVTLINFEKDYAGVITSDYNNYIFYIQTKDYLKCLEFGIHV